MSDPARTVRELKATAHLLTFEPGTYCVFPEPGMAVAADGLPGVRVSAAPGGEAGRVTLAGLRPDGWLGGAGDAALVQVSGGAAQVLFTIYQAGEGGPAAPKLQIMRLTAAAASAVTSPVATSPVATPPVRAELLAHQYGAGDIGGRLGEWIGARGSGRWLEGVALAPLGMEIEYQAVLGEGWLSPWSETGQFCGSRGMSLPILGLRARLCGAAAETHALSLAATFVDGAMVGPVGDGEVCQAPSHAALEAFQLSIGPKPADPKPAGPAPAVADAPPPAKRTRRPKR